FAGEERDGKIRVRVNSSRGGGYDTEAPKGDVSVIRSPEGHSRRVRLKNSGDRTREESSGKVVGTSGPFHEVEFDSGGRGHFRSDELEAGGTGILSGSSLQEHSANITFVLTRRAELESRLKSLRRQHAEATDFEAKRHFKALIGEKQREL